MPRGPHGIQTDYGPGIYKVRMRITAEHAQAAYGTFLIVHRGEWRNFRIMEDLPTDRPILPATEYAAIMDAARAFRPTVVQSLGSNNAAWGVAARPDGREDRNQE